MLNFFFLFLFLFRVTNGGKTTLAKKLQKHLPNCSVISQDDFFKVSIKTSSIIHLIQQSSSSKVNEITLFKKEKRNYIQKAFAE